MPDFINEDYGIIKCQCDRCGIGMEYNRYMERPQLAFSIGYQYGVPKYTFTLCFNCLSDFKEARKEAETMYVERMIKWYQKGERIMNTNTKLTKKDIIDITEQAYENMCAKYPDKKDRYLEAKEIAIRLLGGVEQ